MQHIDALRNFSLRDICPPDKIESETEMPTLSGGKREVRQRPMVRAIWAPVLYSPLLFVVSGCYSEEENTADICVFPEDSPFVVSDRPDAAQEFIAGEPVKVSAAFYFGVDIKSRRLACHVDLEDDLLTVETSYEWKGHSGSDALGLYFATCFSRPLPAGTYTLKYADTEMVLVVPSSTPAPCLSAQ